MSLMGFMPTYAALAILLTVVGFSSACLHATGPVMVGRVSGAKIGRGSGWWMFGGELGRTVGPLIIVAAVSALTLRGAALLMAPGIAASLLLFFQLRGLPAARQQHSAARSDLRGTLRLLAPVMLPVSGLVLLPAFVNQALATFLPLFLTREGASLWTGGGALTLWQAAGVIGALAGGTLSDRFGRRLVVAAALVAGPLLMLAFIPAAGWVRFALLVPLGFITLAVTPVLLAVVLENFPHNRALANGVFMAVNFLGGAATAVAVGALSDAFGMRTAYTISALIMLAGLPLVFLLPRRAAGQETAL
jgi:FSR family fosmidomycin resistance protein-like MFS transporter